MNGIQMITETSRCRRCNLEIDLITLERLFPARGTEQVWADWSGNDCPAGGRHDPKY